MKKRVLSMLLTVCMVFTLLPVTAFAGGVSARTEALDLSAAAQNANNLATEGWAWYASASDGYDANTLVLAGLNLNTAAAKALILPGSGTVTTIVLTKGTVNTIACGNLVGDGQMSTSVGSFGIYSEGGLTIKGEGALNVTAGDVSGAGALPGTACDSNGMFVLGALSFEDGTVTATGGATTGKAGVNGRSYGVWCGDALSISGGSVTAVGGDGTLSSCGLCNSNKALSITVGTVSAKNGTAADMTAISSNSGGSLNIGSESAPAAIANATDDTDPVTEGKGSIAGNKLLMSGTNPVTITFAGDPGGGTATDLSVTTTVTDGYTYTGGVLNFTKNGDYSIAMKEGVTTTDKIVVSSGVIANITLNDVNIDVSGSSACAFDMSGAAVTLTLAEGSANSLTSGNSMVALQGTNNAFLTINGTGSLYIESAYTGIYCQFVKINSGTVTVKNTGTMSAVTAAPILGKDVTVIAASKAPDGSDLESYDESAWQQYKYLKVGTPELTVTINGTTTEYGSFASAWAAAIAADTTADAKATIKLITDVRAVDTSVANTADYLVLDTNGHTVDFGNFIAGEIDSSCITNSGGSLEVIGSGKLKGLSAADYTIGVLGVAGGTVKMTDATIQNIYKEKGSVAVAVKGGEFHFLSGTLVTGGEYALVRTGPVGPGTAKVYLYSGTIQSSGLYALITNSPNIIMPSAYPLILINQGTGIIAKNTGCFDFSKVKVTNLQYGFRATGELLVTRSDNIYNAAVNSGKYVTITKQALPDLVVTTGVADGYTYTGGVLNFTKNGDYSIAMQSGVTATKDKIVVSSGVTANITLNGVNIDVSSADNACAFNMTGATVNLTLANGSTNRLKSGKNMAGMQVPEGAALTMNDCTGSLIVTAGNYAAGIGSGQNAKCGTITINGGTIEAYGTTGAGIGGGYYGTGGKITINGGSITASSENSAGIGGGADNGNAPGAEIMITGGDIKASSTSGAGIGGGSGTSISGAISITGGIVTAQSTGAAAMSLAPALTKGATVLTASKNRDGTAPETYDAAKIATYKYLKVGALPNFFVIFDNTITGYDDFAAAWAAAIGTSTTAEAKATIKLNKDVTTSNQVTNTDDYLVLDTNGHTLNFGTLTSNGITSSGGSLEVIGSGKLTGVSSLDYGIGVLGVAGGTVKVTDATIENTYNSTGAVAVCASGGEFHLLSGKLVATGRYALSENGSAKVYLYSGIIQSNGDAAMSLVQESRTVIMPSDAPLILMNQGNAKIVSDSNISLLDFSKVKVTNLKYSLNSYGTNPTIRPDNVYDATVNANRYVAITKRDLPTPDLTVTTEVTGGYTYTGGVLTFTKPGEYTIAMAKDVTSTTDRIVVNGGAQDEVKLNLNGVVICALAGLDFTPAADALTVTSGKVTLNVIKDSALTGGKGVYTYDDSNGIKGDVAITGTARLTASGGESQSTFFAGSGIYGNVTVSGGVLLDTVGGTGNSQTYGGHGIRGNLNVSGTATLTATGGSGKNVSQAVNGTITAAGHMIKAGDSTPPQNLITSGTKSAKRYVTVTPTTYAITKTTATNGSFTVKVGGSEVTTAASGDTVTITPTASSDYTVDTVTVKQTAAPYASVTVSSNSFTMPAYAVTVTVAFKSSSKPTLYTVSFHANGGTGGSLPSSLTQSSEGASVTIPAPSAAYCGTKTGYALDTTKWATAAGGTTYVSAGSYTPTANITFYAVWTADTQTYAITKTTATNGSFTVKVGGSEVTTAASGDTVTITPTAISGYTVDTVTVKQTAAPYASVTVSSNSFTMPAYAVTVTVNFKVSSTPALYTVSFNANGGTNDTLPGSLTQSSEGASVTIPAPSTAYCGTKTGYTLDTTKWATAAGGTTYVSTGYYKPTANVTLYAVWTADTQTYAITKALATNGSFTVKVGGSEVTTAASGDTVTITPTASSDYTVGTVTVKQTAAPYASVTVSSNSFTMPAYAVTVTVTFKASSTPALYTVCFNANGGTNDTLPGSLAQSSEGASVTIPAPSTAYCGTKTGYTLDTTKWATAAGGTTYVSAGSYTPTANITLYVVWTADSTVSGTVDDENGDKIEGATVKLMKGGTEGTQFGTTATTGADGAFSFTDVPYGSYSLVAQKDTKTVTQQLSICSQGVTKTLTMPSGQKITKVEIQGSQTPSAAAGNLNEMFTAKDTAAAQQPNTSVEIKLVVEETTNPADQQDIQGALTPSQTVGLYLDAKLLKVITTTSGVGEPEAIQPPDGKTLHIVIDLPTSLQNKTDYKIIRSHMANGTADVQTITPTYDPKLQVLSFDADLFSTYAIVYHKVGGGSNSGSGGTTIYPPTVNGGDHGSVTVLPKNPGSGSQVTITPKPDEGYVVNKVVVTDKNGNEVTVKDNGDGSYTFTQPTSKVTITVTFKPERPAWKPFTDVTEQDWFHDSVKYVYENGLMQGISDTTFSPYMGTSRGMIVTILWRMEDEPKDGTPNPYADVQEGAYYFDAVAWGDLHGIVLGYRNGNFGPNDPITREQMAAILYRYAKFKGINTAKTTTHDSFADGETVSDYAVEPMKWAVANGLITGKGNGILDPKGEATRAQAAAILTRFDALFIK